MRCSCAEYRMTFILVLILYIEERILQNPLDIHTRLDLKKKLYLLGVTLNRFILKHNLFHYSCEKFVDDGG